LQSGAWCTRSAAFGVTHRASEVTVSRSRACAFARRLAKRPRLPRRLRLSSRTRRLRLVVRFRIYPVPRSNVRATFGCALRASISTHLLDCRAASCPLRALLRCPSFTRDCCRPFGFLRDSHQLRPFTIDGQSHLRLPSAGLVSPRRFRLPPWLRPVNARRRNPSNPAGSLCPTPSFLLWRPVTVACSPGTRTPPGRGLQRGTCPQRTRLELVSACEEVLEAGMVVESDDGTVCVGWFDGLGGIGTCSKQSVATVLCWR